MPAVPFIDSDRLTDLLPWPTVIAALDQALSSFAGDDLTGRVSVPLAHGELLLMPAANDEAVGIKLVGVAPRNPEQGLPRIQALYALLDARSFTPVAILDGTALTTLRTAGQSALVVGALSRAETRRLVVFGTGPQAEAHVKALRAVRPIDTVRILGRREASARALCERLRPAGPDIRPGTRRDVSAADVVVCATNSRTPVFDGADLAGDAFVVAVGSHTPDARELDDTVIARASRIMVEHRQTALKEAGDVTQAIASGVLDEDRILDFTDLAGLRADPGIFVYKSVGMGWQDLALAQAAWQAEQSGSRR